MSLSITVSPRDDRLLSERQPLSITVPAEGEKATIVFRLWDAAGAIWTAPEGCAGYLLLAGVSPVELTESDGDWFWEATASHCPEIESGFQALDTPAQIKIVDEGSGEAFLSERFAVRFVREVA